MINFTQQNPSYYTNTQNINKHAHATAVLFTVNEENVVLTLHFITVSVQ